MALEANHHIFSIFVFDCRSADQSAWLLASSTNMSPISFWYRSSASQLVLASSRNILKTCAVGASYYTPFKNDFVDMCMTYGISHRGLGVVITTDGQYPQRVAWSLSRKVETTFIETHDLDSIPVCSVRDAVITWPWLDQTLTKYKEPSEADSLLKMQKDLDETKEIVLQSINLLLERGIKLEQLLDSSTDLSLSTRAFVKATVPSCCPLL